MYIIIIGYRCNSSSLIELDNGGQLTRFRKYHNFLIFQHIRFIALWYLVISVGRHCYVKPVQDIVDLSTFHLHVDPLKQQPVTRLRQIVRRDRWEFMKEKSYVPLGPFTLPC